MKRLILAIVILLPSTLLAQAFTYAPINVPGALLTEARGINNNGEVVGYYQTSTACTNTDVRVPTCPTKGFKLVNGTYVKLMVPNSISTAIMGVNDLGDLTGFYKKSDGSEHGFIWYHTNIVRTIDFQKDTVPWGINKAGIVVGGFWGTGSQGTFPGGGWVWINGTFSNMNPNNGAGPCCESVTGVSNNGILSGLVFQSDFFQAWMKEATDQDFFTYPSVTQCCDTSGTGVNNNIDMIGFTGGQGWFTKHIELNEVESSGEDTPKFINLNFPGGTSSQPIPTYPFGLNDKRWIAGAYTDSSNHMHGFVAKPNF